MLKCCTHVTLVTGGVSDGHVTIVTFGVIYFLFFVYAAFNSQGHIATASLWVQEPVHTSWSRFCTVNHQASANNYQLSNMKNPGLDLNRQPRRLKASTLTATPPSPLRCGATDVHVTSVVIGVTDI